MKDDAWHIEQLNALDTLLARVATRRPQYVDGLRLNSRRPWTAAELTALLVCCRHGADLEAVGEALGRSSTSIAWQARKRGWRLPPAWRAAIS